MDDVYRCTQKKLNKLKCEGYHVIEVWECQWAKMKQDNEEIHALMDKLDIVEPLNLRDALCGGRTNAIKLYHQTEADEEIDYFDYTSLYPYVNKNGMYPLGHPEMIFQPGQTDISRYFGIAQCTMLPPYELYHPMLLLRQNDKLIFPLCRTCVEEEMTKTHARTKSRVPPHRSTASNHRDLVYPRTQQSGGKRLSNSPYP